LAEVSLEQNDGEALILHQEKCLSEISLTKSFDNITLNKTFITLLISNLSSAKTYSLVHSSASILSTYSYKFDSKIMAECGVLEGYATLIKFCEAEMDEDYDTVALLRYVFNGMANMACEVAFVEELTSSEAFSLLLSLSQPPQSCSFPSPASHSPDLYHCFANILTTNTAPPALQNHLLPKLILALETIPDKNLIKRLLDTVEILLQFD